MFFSWPHSVRYLEESGVWAHDPAAGGRSGFNGAEETAEARWWTSTAREYRATCDAIRGDRYRDCLGRRGISASVLSEVNSS